MRSLWLAMVVAACVPGEKPEASVQQRGSAKADPAVPKCFPHRIWAACDFEAQLPSYSWFGNAERQNIPKYPGNTTAVRGDPNDKNGPWSAMAGCNPVPGPCMGKINKLYCRYFIKGATQAHFQYFSLSVSDNNYIDISGLMEGKWSEVVMNFTENGQRNDGTPGVPFKPGERMDDLKVWLSENVKGAELILDDIIFFAEDPDAPAETEPFPNRVMFVVAFDTGSDGEDKERFFPGEWELPPPDKRGKDNYIRVAGAVPRKDGKGKWVQLKMKPERTAGAHTKARFRYRAVGVTEMTVQLYDATDKDYRQVRLKGLKQDEWTFAYADFTKEGKRAGGKETPLEAGHVLGEISFLVDGGDGVVLQVDEVTVFDAREK